MPRNWFADDAFNRDWLKAVPVIREAMGKGEKAGKFVTIEGQPVFVGGPGQGGGGSSSGGDVAFSSTGEAMNYLTDNKELNPDLTEEEENALFWYKGDGFYDVNNDLRDAGYSEDDRVDLIQDIVRRGKTIDDMIVWRGLDVDVFEDSDNLTGDVFSDNVFISTSLVRSTAESFGYGAMMEIRVPKGTRGISMERWDPTVASFGNESEFLLPDGSKFKILSDSGDEDSRHIVAEVIQ